MLTRNLYVIDEVVSALQICLRRYVPRSYFWAHELYISEEETLLRRILKESWLEYGAPADLAIYTEFSTANVVHLVGRTMAAIQITGSLSAKKLAVKWSQGPRPRVTAATSDPKSLKRRALRATAFQKAAQLENMDPQQLYAWWISYDSACRCYWFRDAIWLLQAVQTTLSADGIWAGIMLASRGFLETKNFIQTLKESAGLDPVDQLRAQAAATVTLCYPSESMNQQRTTVSREIHAQKDWSEWSEMAGTRRARLYEIPMEALHSETTRGSISTKYTNINDIREPIVLLPQGCTFWRRITSASGFSNKNNEVEYPEDSEYQRFYSEQFPDDIPDEWSAADQQKSHGRGYQEKSSIPETFTLREKLTEQEWIWGIHVPAKKLTL